eukprot:53463-Rhodomonas_salina.2
MRVPGESYQVDTVVRNHSHAAWYNPLTVYACCTGLRCRDTEIGYCAMRALRDARYSHRRCSA